MNSNVTDGPWRMFKIQLRETWNELTDEDLTAISRDRDELVRMVQHRYGSARDATTKMSAQGLLS